MLYFIHSKWSGLPRFGQSVVSPSACSVGRCGFGRSQRSVGALARRPDVGLVDRHSVNWNAPRPVLQANLGQFSTVRQGSMVRREYTIIQKFLKKNLLTKKHFLNHQKTKKQWHRFFMLLTWLMTVAAFVLIVVELREWSSQTKHASLGLATTILCFVQPFMALMRPHPGTPRRPLFNWAHWLVGNAAQICGSKFWSMVFYK